jgi:hypothetical protein
VEGVFKIHVKERLCEDVNCVNLSHLGTSDISETKRHNLTQAVLLENNTYCLSMDGEDTELE